MSDLEKLYEKKRKYKNFKANIENLIEQLTNAINELKIPEENIEYVFSINEESADNKKINYIRNELIKERNFLKNTVLQKIISTYSNIKDSIVSMENNN